MPTNDVGGVYTGAMRTIAAKHIREELAQLRERGARVVLMFAGNERHYRDKQGHFSLQMWKDRVDAFRKVDFSEYVEDGTIIAHYLMDEPNDPDNWNGQPVSGNTVEAMAEYSKQLWPRMPTVVRAEPSYLGRTGGPYRYLDAAWAQYVTRKGTPEDYISRNVADAKKLDLALVTGLNIRKGADGGRGMPASLVRSAGRTILANGYSCAFLSWEYDKYYLSQEGIQEAMEALAPLAREHPARSCRSGSEVPPPPPDDQGQEEEPEEPANEAPTAAFEVPGCTAGVPCQFTDGSRDQDGRIVSWSWAFDPGASSSESSPSRTFAEAGSYTVTLTVTDDRGATGSVSRDVVVSRANRAPAAAFDAPRCTAGTPCQFTDQSTDDGTIASRSWQLGNGITSSDANPAATYASAGSYRVTLTVTDDLGATSSITRNVSVSGASLPTTRPIALDLSTYVSDGRHFVRLTWANATGSTVNVFRNGVLRETTRNDRLYIRSYASRRARSYTYQVCETGSSRCSNAITATLR